MAASPAYFCYNTALSNFIIFFEISMKANKTHPLSFCTSIGSTYNLQPLTKDKIFFISNVYGLLDVNITNYPAIELQFLRIVKKHRKESLMLVACCVSTTFSIDEISKIAEELSNELNWADLASLLICVLAYYSKDFENFLKQN